MCVMVLQLLLRNPGKCATLQVLNRVVCTVYGNLTYMPFFSCSTVRVPVPNY
jgi:hypothetical protein